MGIDTSKVGAVVIGRNEEANLQRCFDSLASLGGRVVYADSASTDASLSIARQCGVRIVEVDPSDGLTPARGRNDGFKQLIEWLPDCQFVQFVDGDSSVEPNWLAEGVSFLTEHPNVAVVCGDIEERHTDTSVYNWLCSNEWAGPVGEVRSCGGNALIRSVAFRDVGGFRSDLLAGEEAELMARMREKGWGIWRIGSPMVSHDADLIKFRDWWKRTKRGGIAAAHLCWITRKGKEHLYCSQLRSALFWTLLMPILALLLSIFIGRPASLLLIPVFWTAQTIRIALKHKGPDRWTYARLIMLAKLAETVGAVTFLTSGKMNQSST